MPAILRLALVALTAIALSGCASVMLVDNQVESFPRWQDRGAASAAGAAVPAPPQVYRFERLPSQQDERAARGQDELERYAEALDALRVFDQVFEGFKAAGLLPRGQ